MHPINKRKVAYSYPINFTSPLPIEECATRIRNSFNYRMGLSLAVMYGFIERIDDTTYQFELFQDLKDGRQTISGFLRMQSTSQTLVEAAFEPDINHGWTIMLVIVFTVVLITASQSMEGAIVSVTIVVIFGIYLYRNRGMRNKPLRQNISPPISELLWYFERTLKS